MEKKLKKIYTEEELNNLCSTLQEKLRLQDWDIEVKMLEQHEMPGASGRCRYSIVCKSAIILIPSAESYGKVDIEEQDMALSLIHELLHLHLFPGSEKIENGSMDYYMFEQGLESIARSFHNLINLTSNGEMCYSEEQDKSD